MSNFRNLMAITSIPRNSEWIIIIFCISLLLAPIFIFQYFPSQDGPAHVNSTITLAKLYNDMFLTAYFKRGNFTSTNWIATVTLSIFRHIVTPGRLESAFAIFYSILMITGIILTVIFLFRIPAIYTLLFLPFVYSHMLHMGSFNYALACALFLPLLGLCHRYIQRPSLSLASLIGLVLLFVFAAHVQLVLVGICCVGIYAVSILALAVRRSNKFFHLRDAAKNLRRSDGFHLIAACIPALILCLIFGLRNEGIESHPHYIGLLMKIVHFVCLIGVASFSVFGQAVSILVFCFVIGLTWAVHKKSRTTGFIAADCMLLCAIFILIVFLAMPEGLGDTFNIEERLMIPMVLAFAGWLAIRAAQNFNARILVLIVVSLIVLQTADRMNGFYQINQILDEYAEVASHIPEHSAVIAIDLDDVANQEMQRSIARPFKLATRFHPERAFLGTVLGEREIAFISNYEARATVPYFTLKYQNWLSKIIGDNVFDLMAKDEENSASFSHLIRKLKSGAAPVRYLVVWSYSPLNIKDNNAEKFLDTVRQNYQLLFSSSKFHMRLYKMKLSN